MTGIEAVIAKLRIERERLHVLIAVLKERREQEWPLQSIATLKQKRRNELAAQGRKKEPRSIPMSPENRLKVSRRMKAYWAAKRI